MLPARLRLFLAVAALWVGLFGFGLALDGRVDGPWVLTAPTLLRLGALGLPLEDGWAGLRAGSTLFLHSDALHLTSNLAAWALILLSYPRQIAPRRLIGVFVVWGLIAALGSIVAYSQVGGVSVGPSGALCACLSFALIQPARRAGKLLWLLLALAFLVGGQLASGDQGAHVAGLLGGGLLGFWGRPRPARSPQPKPGEPPSLGGPPSADRPSERSLGLAAGESPL